MAKIGRPPLWATPDELNEDIDRYIEDVKLRGVLAHKKGFAAWKNCSYDSVFEYLSNKGADVYVHDPFFEEAEIKEIIPFVKPVNLNQVNLTPDAIVIMTDHSCYKSFTQEDLDSKGISQCKIILDNVGVFKNFTFSPSTLYHLVGDGKLDLLEQ